MRAPGTARTLWCCAGPRTCPPDTPRSAPSPPLAGPRARHAHAVRVADRSRRDSPAGVHAEAPVPVHVPRSRLPEVAQVPPAQVARVADALRDAVRELHGRQRLRRTIELLPKELTTGAGNIL
jgi:acyl-CoA synthetase (AMP-forming)/AMP-acid ligase II